MTLTGEPVSTFEFRTERALGRVRSAISPRGDTLGPAIISWEPPRFYSSGRLLVVYFGEDVRILSTLRDLLGRKFAGG